MGQLSSVFYDTLCGVDNTSLGRACEAVVKICDAHSLCRESLRGVASALNPNFQFAIGSLYARMSHAVTSDLQRNIRTLEAENTKLKGDYSSSSSRVEELLNKNEQLIDDEKKYLEKIENLEARCFARDSKYRRKR